MAKRFYNQNGTISDTILFNLTTTDVNGNPINPYEVNQIIIYFIERGFTSEKIRQITTTFGNDQYIEDYSTAVPAAIFGTDTSPAWIGTDTADAFITQLDFDDAGNPLTGVFQLQWVPQTSLAREGDYILCYTWTPIAAGDSLSASIQFYLFSDTTATTSNPTHATPPDKYITLLELYLPEMFKLTLGTGDLTPSVLDRFNQALAKGFTALEDLTNQMLDMIDANALADYLLPYLGNLFNLQLYSDDVALWRKQIKRAIPLYKMKGTLSGLTEALANADIQLNSITRLWQVVSQSTWQESFQISADQSDPATFVLKKVAILPVDPANYEVAIRFVGDATYTPLTTDYVTFVNSSTAAQDCISDCITGGTIMTWVGDNLSVNPIALSAGDFVQVTYVYAPIVNQSIEDYIRTLPLADQRDETTITLPAKNWNVRVIAEDDPMFDVIIPTKQPFVYPVVFGKVRTEFPYSENIYNMEEYSGSTRNSTNPCDLDKCFIDTCTAGVSSKFIIDVTVEDLSAERMTEVTDIITNFVPFHAVVHSINYTSSKTEFMPSPREHIEILMQFCQEDNIIAMQFDFNRLIINGADDTNELKRNMLASTNAVSGSGTGANIAIIMFSTGVQFDGLGIDDEANLLEILSGTDTGTYTVQTSDLHYSVDIVQGSPDTINYPLDASAFPYRLSNLLYQDIVSIYQINKCLFSDPNVTFIDYGAVSGWNIVIAGSYTGTYPVTSVNQDGTLTISGFPAVVTLSNINYNLTDNNNLVRYSGTTGVLSVNQFGQVVTDLIVEELGIRSGDWVLYAGTQYQITYADPRPVGATTDNIYIQGYTSGDVIGVANISIYRRLIDNGVGYLAVSGMNLTGTVPTISYVAETNQFLENYLILIGTNYYPITSIAGSTMTLGGPVISWGLTGVAVDYSIIQFIKTSPITTQDGQEFFLLDRRGNDAIEIITETEMPMSARGVLLNTINDKKPMEDLVRQEEKIWFNVEYR